MDYLVFDCQLNQLELSAQQIRKICQRNCALGSEGIVIGPNMDKGGKMHPQLFNAAGEAVPVTEHGLRVFAKYLEDAGYLSHKKNQPGMAYENVSEADDYHEVSYVGRMYLSNEFLQYGLH